MGLDPKNRLNKKLGSSLSDPPYIPFDLSQKSPKTHKLNRIQHELKFAQENLHIFNSLTQREKEVLTHVASGLNNPQIAKTLVISRRTVEEHRKHINRKLKTNNLIDLFHFAQAFNLV